MAPSLETLDDYFCPYYVLDTELRRGIFEMSGELFGNGKEIEVEIGVAKLRALLLK